MTAAAGRTKKPELQGAFGTKKPKLFKVERTTSRRSGSGHAAPQSFWGSLLFYPSLPNWEISKHLIFQYSLQLNSYIKTREMAVPPPPLFPSSTNYIHFVSQNAWVFCPFWCKKENQATISTYVQDYLNTHSSKLTTLHFAINSRKGILLTLPTLNPHKEDVTFSLKTWVSFLSFMSKESDPISQPSPWALGFRCWLCQKWAPFVFRLSLFMALPKQSQQRPETRDLAEHHGAYIIFVNVLNYGLVRSGDSLSSSWWSFLKWRALWEEAQRLPCSCHGKSVFFPPFFST